MRAMAYVDGGCRNNHLRLTLNGRPVRFAYGSYKIIRSNGQELPQQKYDFATAQTNNEAEYLALIRLLEDSRLEDGATIYTDSQLLIGHLTKHWKVQPNLRPYVDHARALLKQRDAALSKLPRKEIEAVLHH